MPSSGAKVLLVGDGAMRLSSAAEYLAEHGCECQSTSRCADGARLVSHTPYLVILCSGRTRGFQELVSAALHSQASIFRYVAVEEGCWWVLTVSRGELPSHAAAFKDGDFDRVLESIIAEHGGQLQKQDVL